MCDTMVALSNVTKDRKVIFGKNSDRSPNEPQLVVRFPARDYDLEKEGNLKVTYITIPQVKHTNEVVLMKPSWMWGAEMGFNEYGLNIGNEAVFTKAERGNKSLIGMDLLRLALERTQDAKSALDLIIDLLQQFGQGGNCGYDHEFYYHNAFLIADKNDAYVLETAGKYYVWKKVKDFYAISNCLSITNEYDGIHPEAIDYAINNKWCKGKNDFSFAGCFTESIFTHFAKSKGRRSCAMDMLAKAKGNITSETIRGILRSHDTKINKKGLFCNSVGSICMHAGGLIGDHTTNSYIAILDDNKALYYTTAASTPCLMPFRPLILDKEMPISSDEEKALKVWLKNERFVRYVRAGQVKREDFIAERDAFEKRIFSEFEKEDLEISARKELIKRAWIDYDSLTNKYLLTLYGVPFSFREGKMRFRKYWKKKTDILFREKQE